MAKPLRIAVVGSGAIGIYYGGKLAAAGRDVHFLMRGHLARVRRDGFRGLCFICLSRTSRTTVERYDYGHITIGEFGRPPQPRTHAIASEFNRSGIKCEVVENLVPERLRKLVWNIPFNSLSILAGGIDTAAIIGDENLRRVTLALMNEVIDAANKCGYALERGAVNQQMERTMTMGAYKPSTLLDFEARKALEIEAIWGEPLRLATSAGAALPRLETIYSLLKTLDQTMGRASKSEHHL